MPLKTFLLSFLISIGFSFSGLLAFENGFNDKGKNLIPFPEKVEWLQGNVLLSDKTSIISQSDKLKSYFIAQIKSFTGLELKSNLTGSSHLQIIFKINDQSAGSNKEAYQLSVSRNKIEITASDEEGLFRGMQTLFQLIPASVKADKNGSIEIPCCLISDKPQFSWRGLHLDCCRHFMSKDFIKRYIDILAYYKLNTFHWRLVEDQGWRIEIKRYPKLTQVGAWRKEADGSLYGGFYTQEDIKEVVAYAQERYINIVPEIEMPGHTLASLAAYPEYSCTGGPFEVTIMWGVMKDIYCAGNDSTFYFLQDVLDEVTALFPGKYIHIGGDEAPKDRWKECPKCQARIKAEGLKDEHALQGYFTKRIAGYLASKGKTVIGWDEVLQGGLAPGMVVQSWRSFQGTIDAVKLGHYTICSPASHTYLNEDPEDLDLRIAYSFKPAPDDLTAKEKKFVLGGEANLWTERAPQETVDSKLFPRILALAEVFWNNPQNKNYDEFYSRVQTAYKDLDARGIKYGRETKVITTSSAYDNAKKEFLLTISKGQAGIDVRYTIDGSDADTTSILYSEPIKINKTTIVKIAAFRENHFIGKRTTLSFDFHKALNSKITLVNKYDERYRAGGENGLIDGVRGTDNFHDGSWQGFEGVDFECVIDLGETKEVSEVSPRFLLNSNSWVFLPNKVEASLSNDGVNFNDSQTIMNDVPQKNSEIILKEFPALFKNKSARYIKVKAESLKVCPDWHPYKGEKSWLFIDEIVVK
jgi:hexosaminidase